MPTLPNLARTKEQKAEGISLTGARAINTGKKAPTNSTGLTLFSSPAFDEEGKITGGGYQATNNGVTKKVSKNDFDTANPTVFTNSSIIEDKIPRLVSDASSLPSYGGFDNPAGGSGGDEAGDSFDEALGFSDQKKKKKGFDYGNYEGTNIQMPHGYYEDTYGADAGVMQQLAQMKKTSDRYYRDQVSNVESDFAQRKAQQESANSQNLANVRQALSLGGSSRYAPVSSAGIASAEETVGIKRLSDIDKQERDAIGEVRAAQENQDYQLMDKKLEQLKTIRTEKADAMTEVQDAQKQSSRDLALAGLVAQGVTDPVKLLQALNGGPDGGDFTLEEIQAGLKNIGTTGGGAFSFDTDTVGPLLGAGFTQKDIQQMQDDLNSGQNLSAVLDGVPPEMQAAVKEALGVPAGTDTSGLQPGTGATDSDGEYIIRQRLFTSLKNQLFGKNSSDKEGAQLTGMIANLRGLGLSPQQIIDQLTGFTPGIETPYNTEFANVMRANLDDPSKVTSELQSLSQILSTGDYKKAMQKVENVAMANALKLDPNGYMGDTTAKTMLENARDLKNAFEDAKDIVGPFSGSYQQLLGKLKSGDAAKLKAKIVTLTAQFRNQLSGTAVTESEAKFLEPLIAEITDSDANFSAKLDELERGTLNKLNQTRGTVSLPNLTLMEATYPAHRLPLYASEETFEGTNAPQL